MKRVLSPKRLPQNNFHCFPKVIMRRGIPERHSEPWGRNSATMLLPSRYSLTIIPPNIATAESQILRVSDNSLWAFREFHFTWNCFTSWAARRVQLSLYKTFKSSVIDQSWFTVLQWNMFRILIFILGVSVAQFHTTASTAAADVHERGPLVLPEGHRSDFATKLFPTRYLRLN